jgi:hypothetical protein
MVGLNGMQGMIAAYVASPQGQETIRNYLASPEGKKTIGAYLATPEGQDMGSLIFNRILEGLDLPEDIRGQVLAAAAEKMRRP